MAISKKLEEALLKRKQAEICVTCNNSKKVCDLCGESSGACECAEEEIILHTEETGCDQFSPCEDCCPEL